MENRLSPHNCNKAKCKTCIFGDNPILLSPERINEIHRYLASFKYSHICHTTNLTCYGAVEFQAKIMYAFGVIKSPTVDAFLLEASKYLNFDS